MMPEIRVRSIKNAVVLAFSGFEYKADEEIAYEPDRVQEALRMLVAAFEELVGSDICFKYLDSSALASPVQN